MPALCAGVTNMLQRKTPPPMYMASVCNSVANKTLIISAALHPRKEKQNYRNKWSKNLIGYVIFPNYMFSRSCQFTFFQSSSLFYGYPCLWTPWMGVLLDEGDCLLLEWRAYSSAHFTLCCRPWQNISYRCERRFLEWIRSGMTVSRSEVLFPNKETEHYWELNVYCL